MQEQKIHTEFGTLWTACSNPKSATESSPAIIFLHGNSVDSRIFDPLLQSQELKDRYKLIIFDFPGHGRSDNAPNPDQAYFQYAFAEAALEVLQHYNVKTIIAVGWSLGGHVALELLSVLATAKNTTHIRMVGAVITGTPPVRKQKIAGFRADVNASAFFNPQATDEELKGLAYLFTGSNPAPDWLVESIIRTDRAAGMTTVVKFMQGNCSDQVELVQNYRDGWIAVINGAADPLLELDYCDEVCNGAPRLWRGKCIRLEGQKHSPFYDDPDGYRKLLLEFLNDCGTQ